MKQSQEQQSPAKKKTGESLGILKKPALRMNTQVNPKISLLRSPMNESSNKFSESISDPFTASIANVSGNPVQAPIFDVKTKDIHKLAIAKNKPIFKENPVIESRQQEHVKVADMTPHFTGTKTFEQEKFVIQPDMPNGWRAAQDPLKMYQLDKYFKVGDVVDEKVRELSRWKQNDTKGTRRTQYVKEVLQHNDLILIPVDQTPLERLQNYEDGWPCLNFRKMLLKTKIYINMAATRISSHKAFETISITVILLNSITLASEDPNQKEKSSYMNVIENLFLSLYTIEMIIKIISKGFVFNKGAYLRDAFNVMDFVIVMSAYLTIFQEFGGTKDDTGEQGGKKQKGVSLAGLRAFRVLRPLRSITAIRGLKILVQSLLSALPLLKDTIIVLIFFLLIMAIAGMQLMTGSLKNRCVNLQTGQMWENPEYRLSDRGVICGALKCPVGYFCGKMNANPDNGVTNFDNIFYAFLGTFQNITLEGWSDTQKYYEQSSGIFAIAFFIPSVFIGAFFLLNLTLAVINSSFSRTHEFYQKQFQEEKERKRKLLQLTAKPEKDDEQNDEHDFALEAEEQDEKKQEIGLTEFYIAKRAAGHMIKFYRKRMEILAEQKKRDEEEKKAKEAEENEDETAFGNQVSPATDKKYDQVHQILSPKEMARNPIEEEPLAQGSKLRQKKLAAFQKKKSILESELQRQSSDPGPLKSPTSGRSRDQQFPVVSKMENNSDSSPLRTESDTNKTITEEESSNVDENHDQQVAKFLQELDSDHGVSQGVVGDKSGKQSSPRNEDQKQIKFFGLEDGLRNNHHNVVSANMIKQQPSIKESRLSDHYASNILDELGLEKVIAEEHLQPQNVQNTKKPSDEPEESNSFDISWDYPQYSDAGRERRKSFDDARSSAISSDSSFKSNILKLEAEANTQKKSKALLPPQKRIISKDVRKRFRRTNTTDHKKKQNDVTGVTGKSTLSGDNKSFQPGIDSAANSAFLSPSDFEMEKRKLKTLTIPGRNELRQSFNSAAAEKSPRRKGKNDDDTLHKKKPTDVFQAKKAIKENYQLIDEHFLNSRKPRDPFSYIDKKTKKIDINPGVKYVSSSQHEILDSRYQKAQKRLLNQINKYLKPPQQEDAKVVDYQDDYIEPLFEAYQLKNRYQTKEVENIEFGSDDEDNLILAIQPYDTVLNVGHSDMLIDSNTKFLARRSDIIVSSTMSITLTPQDDEFKIKDLNKLNEEEITNWVNLRHEFRSLSVNQAKLVDADDGFLLMKNNSGFLSNSKGSDSGSNGTSYNGGTTIKSKMTLKGSHLTSPKFGSESHDKSDQKLSMFKKFRLPEKGLSKPLTVEQANALEEDQKLIYGKWKGKYEATLRMIKKQKADPNGQEKFNYSLEDAKKMMEGAFHEEHENEELAVDVKLGQASDPFVNKIMFLNRDTHDLKQDLDLAGFEKTLAKFKEENNRTDQEEERSKKLFEEMGKKDCVPDEIRKEFDIPDDLGENAIDFNEVRRSDAARKRKVPVWSGQDVLCISLNRDHAEAITEQMTSIRVWPKGFFGVVKRFRFMVRKFVNHSLMDNLMTLCVLINTIVMALDRYGIDENEKNTQASINSVFTYIFICELGLKQIAFGPKKYIDNRMNIIDGTVVFLSIIELSMGSGGGALSAFRSVRVFRTFRVLRVARILRSLKSMQNIISVISRSASSFAYIAMLLIIFLFIYALLGIQVFGGKFNFPEGKPRGNYDSFNIAFFTAFQTLTMENWNSLLYDAMRSKTTKLISAVYYISWIFIGNFILLNLFLAILLDSFLEEDEEEQSSEEAEAAQKAAEELQKEKIKKEKERRQKKIGQSMFKTGNLESNIQRKQEEKNKGINNLAKAIQIKEDPLINDIDDLESGKLKEFLIELKYYTQDKKDVKKLTFADAEIECNKSIYLFSQQNWFRIKMFEFSKSKFFDNTVMVLIVLSSCKLAADTYIVDQVSTKTGIVYQFSYWLDLAFTILFTVEMLTKQISMGLIMDNGSYLRESWNQLDFFIVITSLVDLMMTGKSLGFIKIIRLLRILRPLRFISHNKAMKMIVSALLDSGGSMVNVIIVIMVVWLMFAILAVNLFSGKLFYCQWQGSQYTFHTKYDCNSHGGSWVRRQTNYDNILQAMMALFIISTFEGWPDNMAQAMDATSKDKGPSFENQILYGYFFVIFILIGSFFFVNFFIGVLFLKYTQAQKEEQKGYTQEHLNWIDIQKMIEKAEVDHAYRYQPKHNRLRLKFWKIVNSDIFGAIIMVAILLNMVQMACQYEGQPAYWKTVLKISNYIFSAIFIVEATFKLFTYRRAYFYTAWNKFDFFVVVSSILDIMLDFVGANKLKALSVGPQLARVLRVLRVSRVLRLAGKNEGLQALLMTIQMSVASLLNVTLLLILIFFMFSVLGVFMFQNVTTSDSWNTLQQLDPQYKNFKNFGNGMILLFVISTGENWPLVMYDVANQKPFCEKTTCGNKLAPLYFIMFVMVVQKIMLNLFILVIIQQFEQYYVSEDNPIQKFKKNLEIFSTVWIEMTAKHDHVKIKEKALSQFFRKLPLPIGFPPEVDDQEMKKQILKMGIRSNEDCFIFFNELLYRCMRRIYGNFKLNRRMTVYEITIQFKLLKLTLQQTKADKQNDSQKQEAMLHKLSATEYAFNPFMTNMYFKISFMTWLNIARNSLAVKEHEKHMEELRKIAEEEGREFSPSQMPMKHEGQNMRTTWLEEEEIVYISSESDEESASRTKSLRYQMSETSKGEKEIKSPEMHRQKAQFLQRSVTKRFNNQFSGIKIKKMTSPQTQNSSTRRKSVLVQENRQNSLMRLGLDEKVDKKNKRFSVMPADLGKLRKRKIDQ